MREISSDIRGGTISRSECPGDLADERARNAQNGLALAMMHYSYPAKHFVFCENEPSLGVFVVLTGGVELSVSAGDGERLPIHVARRGEILGLAAALSGKPNQMTARTIEDTKITSIRLHQFLGFLIHHPDVWTALEKELNTELTVTPELSDADDFLAMAS